MSERFAEVIVDLSNEAVDRLFTYRIPAGMALTPGQRVEVPFGPRTLEGYVIALKGECDLPGEKVKDVRRALEDYPVILPELIELAQWMKRKYHCNLVDGLRQMIPAAMRGGRVHEKTVSVVSLCVSGEEARAYIEKNRRAKARVRVLEALENGPKPLSYLNELSPGAAKSLAEQGLVRIESDEVLRSPFREKSVPVQPDPELTPQQKEAVAQLTEALRGGGGRFLLHGVTGSGKTEVYIRAIRETLQSGRTAIVLVPEISLTPQMVDWFRARFGGDAAVLHSRLSDGERFDEWRRIRRGEARVVIGARSAVFAPLDNLGIIIVDEEHESSYQSDKRPRYDARDIARRRADYHGGVLLLGSATPSIATYMKVMPGVKPVNRLTLLEMNQRVNGRALPEVQIVDMREELVSGNRSIFSGALIEAMKSALADDKQVILFLNRRGYAHFVSCRSCGYVEKCEHCDVSLTYHMEEQLLKCHYCGFTKRPPTVCPECGSRFIRQFGAGTQKVEEEVRARFPGVPVARMDVDTTGAKGAHERILGAFRRGETRVLVGTQMIAKGLDFPRVTLVGVVAADMTLNVPDYRSVERTFQLLTQVAGRAGRADFPGKVIVQTYEPDNYGIRLAARQDYRAFYFEEERVRRRALYPPFTVLARLLVSSKDGEKAKNTAEALEKQLGAMFEENPALRRDVVQYRALEAPIKLLRGEVRYMVFIKMYARGASDEIVSRMEEMEAQEFEEGVRVELEVNPASMM